ncbi:hypothetical protein WA026_006534 [Henosepilachna vigintioctopunctata]|uniref:Carboxypeptidase inhibitor n=1 Tax=Henosepilachna vigintioctopunctata TaxID=420089 RepID=A0AAW1UJ80_9CUCU
MFFKVLFSLLLPCWALESNFYREEPCANVRGYCVLEKECPHSVESSFKQLCRNQMNEGAVCCQNFPTKQLNCLQLHNECKRKSECPDFINLGQKGCKPGDTCCVLVS